MSNKIDVRLPTRPKARVCLKEIVKYVNWLCGRDLVKKIETSLIVCLLDRRVRVE